MFVNDVHLGHDAVSLAGAFTAGGYDTAYVGKWHLDGRGRSSFIPRDSRQGFDYWKVLECTHDYNRSAYYAGDSDEKRWWDGYDAAAQTRDAIDYLRTREGRKPFFIALSWGPPHNPCHTAPEPFQRLYRPENIEPTPNVPGPQRERSRELLAGYYAHGSALDACAGDLLAALGDEFLPGMDSMRRWHYPVNDLETVPYAN